MRTGVGIFTLLGLAVVSFAARENPGVGCRRACANTVRACVDAGRRRSACRKDILHRCRTEGPHVCAAPVPRAAAGVTASVVDDDFVKSSDPGHNFGHSTILVVSGGTLKYAFLRVSVAGVGPDRTVTSAILRLQVASASGSGSSSGGTVHPADCAGWTETTLTWTSQPSFGAALGPPAGAVGIGQDVDFDVGAAITGDGDYCFAWDSPSSDQVVYNSREATVGAPLVLLTVSAGGSSSPPTTTTSSTTSTSAAVTTPSTRAAVTTTSTTTSVSLPAAPPPTLPATLVLEPVADTYVNAGSTASFGSSKVLLADARPVCIVYLRFVVAGVGARVVDRAVLRLHVDAASSAASASGGRLHQISDHRWQEAKLTYKQRPPVNGPILATRGAVKAKQIVDFDLKGTVTGDGTYDLAIDTTSSDNVSYRSREATTGRPQLILTLGQPTTTSTTLPPTTTTTTTLAPSTTTTTTLPGGGGHLKTVFIIMLENHDWSSFKGSSNAPYINGTLLPRFAHAENYLSGGIYPSLPNYITLEAGTNFGLLGLSPLPTAFRIDTTAHLTTSLNGMGVSWKSYSEDLPGGGTVCPLTESNIYSLDHNAFTYFNDVTGNPPDPTNAYCMQHIRPYSELAVDLQNGGVARYNFIVPNDQDQGEKHVTPGSNLVAQADGWLATAVPAILASTAYQDGGVLFVIWDESKTHGVNTPIGCIAISPLAKPGYANSIAYSHASTLRTVQEIFGSTPFLGAAADATDLSDLFTTFP